MRNLFGLVVVIFGLAMLMQQLNVPGARQITESWWPLAIIIVGLVAWYQNQRRWFGPMMIVLVGVIILIDQWGVFSQSAWNYFWPLIIIVIGARLLIGRSRDSGVSEPSGDTGPADVTAFFSGIERKVTGELKDSSASAWFGGAKIDLRDAHLTDQSQLHVTAAFGGIDIIVPTNVKIVSKVTAIFGGVEDKTAQRDTTVTLRLDGLTLFGGVSVKN